MGESKMGAGKSKVLPAEEVLETAGGRIRVRWEKESAATPLGQLAYFVEFLTATGLWGRWQEDCPLHYVSPNAPTKADVLGTWLLSVLAGHRRYSHVTGIRGDGVNPGLLGMKKIISEDSLRRALAAIGEEEGVAWLDKHLKESTSRLLERGWILDIDTTIKPLYGKQEGAVISYNHEKPGRPSHSYHTYLMAGLRLVLGAEVRAGNEHSGSHSMKGLLSILDDLPAGKKPRIVRGDSGFGSDSIMEELETRGQGYLFKLRLSRNVKRHIEQIFWESGWSDAGQGWQGKEGRLCLSGWKEARRVVVIRRPLKGQVLLAKDQVAGQELFGFVETDCKVAGYEYGVLVTNLDYDVMALGQLYRDRADAENIFDELKNQWGWGGFVTHDLARCQLSARTVALVYNWWNLFVRLAFPGKHHEAITSRPLLMAALGRKIEHAGQTTIVLTALHANSIQARQALMRVSALLKTWVQRS